ncbi:HAD-IA family hydrolase [Rhodovulum adriaticum]|uniref:Phosphoglycolate phosphatase n=1 Tax=Rhodovulum adriaticum TaxID=35804 RepID=A0A4R2NHH2_RHOAD|nr:HAD-IA family hydrolase [Rhodovulum adriaticum]MBK1636812.1 HAD family hydrolase [Rhodovulum adriaticum]TCP20672.1 phosphoglycolate phosphatase [Rhodovulum adriaticum]
MSGLKLVVFDVDGTLVDSQDMIVRSVSEAFAGLDLPVPDRAAILSIVGLSLPQAFARLAPDLSPAGLEAAATAYRQSFFAQRQADGAGAAVLYPGARAALDGLRARDEVLMGVATGKARRGLVHVIDTHGLHGYFQTTQTADDHPSKPHPSMLQAALAETGLDPRDAVMIGDTSFDIEMGRAAGYRTVGVAWGYHPVEALHTAGADRVIGDFAALDAVLSEMWEG